MKTYLKPTSKEIALYEDILQNMYGSEGNNQDPGDGEGGGGSFAPARPGWSVWGEDNNSDED